MKRFIIFFFLLSSFLSWGQGRPTLPVDTFPVPNNLSAYTFIASKGDTIKFWSISQKRWIDVIGGSGGNIDSLKFTENIITLYRHGLSDIWAAWDSSKFHSYDFYNTQFLRLDDTATLVASRYALDSLAANIFHVGDTIFHTEGPLHFAFDENDPYKIDTLIIDRAKADGSTLGVAAFGYGFLDNGSGVIRIDTTTLKSVFSGTAGSGTTTNALSISSELHSGGATTFNGSSAVSIGIQAGSVTNSMLAGSIAYSKLSLTGAILNADLSGSIDAAKINTGVVSNTEFNYLDGVTSAIQTQLNGKQGTLTLTTTGTSGAATLVGNTLNIPQYSGGGFTLSGRATDFSNKAVILYDTVATTYSYADILLAKLTNVQNNDFVIDSSGYWVNRNASQVKTVLSLNNVENTALSAWAGTSNITTVGTITTGVWHGTALTSTYLPSTVVYNTGSYADPSWITSLAASKITGTKTSSFISDFTTAVQTVGDARYLQSYTETDPKRVTTAAFSGTTTKTLTLTLADASTVTASFTDATGGGGVSFGTTTQIPYMNTGGTDFLYSSGLTFDGSNLSVSGKINANSTQVIYVPDQTNFLGSFVIGDGGLNMSHSGTNDGRYNTFIGIGAGNANTTGYNNMAQGYRALYQNTTGQHNIGIGKQALYANTTGSGNSGVGTLALFSNTSGSSNVAEGYQALYSNTTGGTNTAVGVSALQNLSSGSNNIGIGYQAGRFIADGTTSNATDNQSIYIGVNTKASATGNTNEIVLGYNATGNGSNTVTIGNSSVADQYFYGNLHLLTAPSTYSVGGYDVLVRNQTTGNVEVTTLSGGSMVYPAAGIAVSTGSAWGTSITDNSTNWNTAYTDRMKWDGGSTGLNASTGRTSLGATTVGSNLFTLTNPSAITFPRINADNTVSALDAATFRTAIGAQASGSYLTSETDPIIKALNGVVIGNNGSAATAITGTANQLLRRNAANTAYEFFTPSYLTANQTITLSGDVSGSGTTAITTTIGSGKVTNAMLAGSIALSKLSITGTPDGTKFLRDDGSWQVVGGSGTISSGTTNNIPKYTASTTLGASVIWESSGKVGINQGTPLSASSLTIKGQGTNSSVLYSLYTTDNAGTFTAAINDKGDFIFAGTLKGALYTIGTPSGDYTIPQGNIFFKLLDLTALAADQTVTFPSPSSYAGQSIKITNLNTNATYHWLVSGTVINKTGGTISQLTNSTAYEFISDGSSWIQTNN